MIIKQIINKAQLQTIVLSHKTKIRLSLLALILLPFYSLLAQNPNPNAALENTILSEMNTKHFPGASTIIVKGGKIVWIESYGFADVANSIPVEDTTVFLLASLSKIFTGTAAMQLVQSGIIDLDEDINNHLPFTIDIPNFTSDSITLRQLMTHSASIADNDTPLDTYYDYPDPTIPLADCIQRYFSTSGVDYNASANFSNNLPGTNYHYSNIGTALNGYVTEAASGMLFDQFCNMNIFIPLCMNKTAWYFSNFEPSHVAKPYSYQGGNYVAYPHYGFADYPDGQLRSTAMDLSNFMIAYLNGGTLGSSSILSAASINQMWSSQIPGLDPTQGLNWYQESFGAATLWGHNGGEDGVSTEMYFDPINNIGVCVITNGEGNAFPICEALYQYALTLNSNTGITPSCSSALPLELISFEVEQHKDHNYLFWQSASEINTDFIQIEKSNDGKEWLDVEKINAKENSSIIQDYEWMDYDINNGNTYYRLKMVDLDGQYNYSEIVSIKRNKGGKTVLVSNPVYNKLVFVNPNWKGNQAIAIEIVSINNRQSLVEMNHPISAFEIDISKIRSGIYIARVTSNGKSSVHKFVKL